MYKNRMLVWLGAMLAAGAATMFAGPASAQSNSTIRIGMTVSDIPTLAGAPTQGGEGLRFAGLTLYDGLVNWNLKRSDIPAPLEPGLATEWAVDQKDQTKWIFKLRQGVKFHDGSTFNADAVVFSLKRLRDKDAPYFDAKGAAEMGIRFPSIKEIKKVDDYTIEIVTKEVDAQLPYQLTWFMIVSPTQYAKVGNDPAKFGEQPSGTGPFKLEKLVPRDRAIMVPNADYWNEKRRAKSTIILRPIPEAATRTAALLSGELDWIEAPSPDTIPRLKSAGMQIMANSYPHIWPYTLSMLDDSPWKDVRVRKAVNLAINRDGLVQLLGGMAEPSYGQVNPGHPWYGNPKFKIRYDPEEAKRLLKEAGYGPDKPLKTKMVISTGGSGQMQPLPMNEYIQQNLKEVGVDMEFEVVEWGAMRVIARAGAKAPNNKGFHGINNSYGTVSPFDAFDRFFPSDSVPPSARNWGYYKDPWVDEMIAKAKVTFAQKEQDEILAQVHTKLVDDAVWIWIVKDLNPRALGKKVRGFVAPQSWYVDLTSIYKEK